MADDYAMDQEGEGGLSPKVDNAVPGKAADAGAVPKPARAPRKKDPKLDLDLLEADGGFNDIWHKMAPAFKASFQGEGHEVADLRRLLELYQRWQVRFYPHCDFDTFVTKLEKAGRSKVVKAKMGSMRQNLLGLIFPEEPMLAASAGGNEGKVEGQAVNGAIAPLQQVGVGTNAAAAAAASPPSAGPMASDVDKDDELVALQREAEWEAAYAAMDELEVAAQPTKRLQEQTGQLPTATSTVDVVGMEELMQLADEMHYAAPPTEQPLHGQLSTVPSQASSGNMGLEMEDTLTGVPNASVNDADVCNSPDDELMALAMGCTVAPTKAAAALSSPAVIAAERRDRGSADLARDQDHNPAFVRADAGEIGGSRASASEVQDAIMEDEELLRLAAMDTSEAEAVVTLQHGRTDPSAVSAPSREAFAADVHGGIVSTAHQYANMEEIDAELLALAEANTQATQGIGHSPGGADTHLALPQLGAYGRCGGGGSAEGRGARVRAGSNGRGSAAESIMVNPISVGSATGGPGVNDGSPKVCPGNAGSVGSGGFVEQNSQRMETGMLLRDILMTQTQAQDEHVL